MEAIIVRGDVKEIAALALELQKRQIEDNTKNKLWSDDMSVVFCDAHKDGVEYK